MTEPTWQDTIADVLAEPGVGYHRSYYPAGELTDAAVVVTVQRVDQGTFEALSSGAADYQPALVPSR